MRRAAAGHCGTDGRILPRAEEATALLHVGMAILPTATRSEEAIATKAEPLYVAKEHVLEPSAAAQDPTSLRFAAWAWAYYKTELSFRAPSSIAAAARDRPQTSHDSGP